MCGIAGTYSYNGDAKLLELASIEHRGPDGSGNWTDLSGRCWLGHTRLAILDVSEAGKQPMSSADGRYVLTFNGEIYNHLELRSTMSLPAWRGHSDTETLVELWARSGKSCLNELRGMFAFAIYDLHERTLTLVRDRIGIKPLYFIRDSTGIGFCSEIRSLIQENRPAIDPGALATYLAFGHMPPTGEIFEQVEPLGAGEILEALPGGQFTRARWWPEIHAFEAKTPNRSEAVAEVRRLISNSVREHLISDVPLGCFLSGGVDSSIIAMVAADNLSEPLKTFTLAFPGHPQDEALFANLLARSIRADHHEIALDESRCIEWVVQAIERLDLPSVDAINTYIVSKAVKENGITVALSGLGGDELFGGYPSFKYTHLLSMLSALPMDIARFLIQSLPFPKREKLCAMNSFSAYDIALGLRCWRTQSELRAAAIAANYRLPTTDKNYIDSFAATSASEMAGYMEPMLLRDSDQMSMAVGLELRVPLLDHRLVEYCLSIPRRLKCGNPPKQLLVEAFRDRFPDGFLNRPKQGFELPMRSWMNGPLRRFCEKSLQSLAAFIPQRFIDSNTRAFENGRSHWTRLWQLVVIGDYMQKYSTRETLSK